MYSKKVLAIFQNPKNAGGMKGANAVGKVGNSACGDIMKIYLKVEDGVIEDARFKTFGCCAAIASIEVACDLIKGKTLEEAVQVTNKDVFEVLGELPPQKIHCSVLAEEAIRAAVENYHERLEKDTKKKSKTTDDEEE